MSGYMGEEYGIERVDVDEWNNVVIAYMPDYTIENLDAIREAFPRVDMYEVWKRYDPDLW